MNNNHKSMNSNEVVNFIQVMFYRFVGLQDGTKNIVITMYTNQLGIYVFHGFIDVIVT